MAVQLVSQRALSPQRAFPWTDGGCPLLALSGHFWMARRMSAFVGKADISDACSNVCL